MQASKKRAAIQESESDSDDDIPLAGQKHFLDSHLKNLCNEAARSGHLDVLRWFRKKGCPWDAKTCAAAAEGGHLWILEWLRKKGCPWDEATCSYAAHEGHLEVLQWARKNGCPWNKDAYWNAAIKGHLAVLEWLHGNGCPGQDKYLAYEVATNNQLEVLQWLVANGCWWFQYECWECSSGDTQEWIGSLKDDSTCLHAASCGDYDVFVWAVGLEFPYDKQACIEAAKRVRSNWKEFVDIERWGAKRILDFLEAWSDSDSDDNE